tara:strand:- start:1187 stop:1381 length:195 start_codon:yes stop_codon:yes gene_type:complete
MRRKSLKVKDNSLFKKDYQKKFFIAKPFRSAFTPILIELGMGRRSFQLDGIITSSISFQKRNHI